MACWSCCLVKEWASLRMTWKMFFNPVWCLSSNAVIALYANRDSCFTTDKYSNMIMNTLDSISSSLSTPRGPLDPPLIAGNRFHWIKRCPWGCSWRNRSSRECQGLPELGSIRSKTRALEARSGEAVWVATASFNTWPRSWLQDSLPIFPAELLANGGRRSSLFATSLTYSLESVFSVDYWEHFEFYHRIYLFQTSPSSLIRPNQLRRSGLPARSANGRTKDVQRSLSEKCYFSQKSEFNRQRNVRVLRLYTYVGVRWPHTDNRS